MFFPSCQMVLKFRTKHDSIIAVHCTKSQKDLKNEMDEGFHIDVIV